MHKIIASNICMKVQMLNSKSKVKKYRKTSEYTGNNLTKCQRTY